jgi:hypothetical protein
LTKLLIVESSEIYIARAGWDMFTDAQAAAEKRKRHWRLIAGTASVFTVLNAVRN